jgi:hypothetical protein
MKTTFFWEVALCILVDMRHLFIRTSFLHLQSEAYSAILNKAAAGHSEMSVYLYLIIRRYPLLKKEGSYSLHFAFYHCCQHKFVGKLKLPLISYFPLVYR